MRDAPAQHLILFLTNSVIALHGTSSLLVFGGLVVSVFGILATVTATAGITSSPGLLGRLILLSLAIAITVSFVCRLLRWNLIAWGIHRHLKPIATMRPGVLIGIGPGGALIAAMIAKQLIDMAGYEPFVSIVDRVFKREGAFLDVQVGEIGKLTVEVGARDRPILLVTSEVHTGNTLQKVSTQLKAAGIDHRSFAFLASPLSCYRLDHCVLASDVRSILPWRDSPTRDE